MKKKSIINLIRYHAENNDPGFRADADTNRAYAIKTLDMQWAAIESAISSLTARGFLLSDAPAEELHETKKKAKAHIA